MFNFFIILSGNWGPLIGGGVVSLVFGVLHIHFSCLEDPFLYLLG